VRRPSSHIHSLVDGLVLPRAVPIGGLAQVVEKVLQPRAQPVQIDRAELMNQTRPRKRKSVEVSAPTGQMSTTLPEYLSSSGWPGRW